jgi:tetratricopeptide (TPR) repeat protein|tara:strand:- start:998 stop:1861 length:864 start_codon:yes stop_codon:yes gene_type:complete
MVHIAEDKGDVPMTDARPRDDGASRSFPEHDDAKLDEMLFARTSLDTSSRSASGTKASSAPKKPTIDELNALDDADPETHKLRGNACFATGDYLAAEAHYTAAIERLPPPPEKRAPPPPSEDDELPDEMPPRLAPDRQRAVFYANRAACLLKRERYEEAAADCTAAIDADDQFAKAYHRRGVAREHLEDFEGALADYEMCANELEDGTCVVSKAAVERLKPIVEQKREAMRGEMMGKLKDLGNSLLGNFGLSVDNFKAEKDENTGSYNIQFVPGGAKNADTIADAKK